MTMLISGMPHSAGRRIADRVPADGRNRIPHGEALASRFGRRAHDPFQILRSRAVRAGIGLHIVCEEYEPPVDTLRGADQGDRLVVVFGLTVYPVRGQEREIRSSGIDAGPDSACR